MVSIWECTEWGGSVRSEEGWGGGLGVFLSWIDWGLRGRHTHHRSQVFERQEVQGGFCTVTTPLLMSIYVYLSISTHVSLVGKEVRVGVEWGQKPGPTLSSSAVICRQKSCHWFQAHRSKSYHQHTHNLRVCCCAAAEPPQGHIRTTHNSSVKVCRKPSVRKELLPTEVCESQHKAKFLQDV